MGKKDKQEQSFYECSICHETFETMAELYGHKTVAHPEEK